MKDRLGIWSIAVGAVLLLALSASVNWPRSDHPTTSTAAGSHDVGTFSCTLSSTDPTAVVSAHGDAVTLTLPRILSSGSGDAYSNFAVKNSGTMPAVVHWTEATSGTIAWSPAGRMSYTAGSATNPLRTDLTLAPGNSHQYDTVGFLWAPLTNADLGKTASLVFTAHCGEVPAPVSKIQFVGVANAASKAALTLPAGSQPEDIALVMTYGSSSGSSRPQVPTGYTELTANAAGGSMTTDLSYRVLVAGDTEVPTVSTGYGLEVAVYRGVARVGAHSNIGGDLNNVGGTAYPVHMSALTLTRADGSSWVVGMGGDSYALTDARAIVFNSNTTNRSANLPDNHTRLVDTNGGVTAWADVTWPGDNLPLPWSHGVVVHSIELLSK